jgi:hypothetical protein
MKPDLDRFFEVAMLHLMTNVGPALGSDYEQSNTMVLGVMLGAVREELDRAAARRVEENATLRALFADASPCVEEAALASRLEAAAATKESSLLVSDLERSNSELRALLIELHAQVETLETSEARRIEEGIWRELVASTERRKLAMGPF